MENNDYRRVVWELMDRIRTVVYSRSPAISALRLLFLKYAIDNCVGASTKEEFLQFSRAQKMFALRDASTNGIETIIPVLQNIDHAYGLNDILASQEIIDEYARELFGIDSLRQKKNADEDGFRSLLEYMGGIDLEETNGHENGQSLVRTILSVIDLTSDRSSFSNENMTPSSISRFAKAILQVRDSDTFLDFAAGTGISSVIIAEDTRPRIINIEIEKNNAATSAMLFILYGFEHFQVICEDGISRNEPFVRGNKIFVDPPFGAKLREKSPDGYTDATLAAIDRILHNYLDQNGRAVIAVPSSFLFQMKPQAASLRGEMVTLGLVRAVISLPSLTSATSSTTHLLVLDMNLTFDVQLIDLTRALKGSKSSGRPSTELTDDLIFKVAELIDHREIEEEFSCIVPSTEITARDYNLVPAAYLASSKEEEDDITIEEINTKLEELYRQLIEK